MAESTVLFSEIVAAVDPEREGRPEPGYEFSNGRTFAEGSYPKDYNDGGE
ncbi:MAG: hypothetical protein AB7I29_14985 [Geobacter sp.]